MFGGGRIDTEVERTCGFSVGERVVAPRHGVGTVVERRSRALNGSRREYLTIEIERHSLRLRMPIESVSAARLRPLASRAEVRRAVEELSAPPRPLAERWRERQKSGAQTLGSGDLLAVAGLLRDLAHAAKAKRPSTTDRELYDTARDLLDGEVQAVVGASALKAQSEIDRRLPSLPARSR